MLICTEKECSCSHHRLLECIKLELNDEAKELFQGIENYAELTNNSGKTFLHYSAEYSNVEITKVLIDKGCKVNAQDNNGVTPLMHTIGFKPRETNDLIEILLDNKADIFLSDSVGVSTLQRSYYVYVTSEKFYDEVDFAQNASKKPCYAGLVNSLDRRRTASDLQNQQQLNFKSFIERVNNYFLTDRETTIKSLLNANRFVKHACVASCNIEVASFILQSGNPVMANFHEPKFGLTALHCASMLGNVDNVKLLIEDYKVDIDALDGTGTTSLMWAVKTENLEVVKILLKNNANIFITDDNGNSAFQRSLYTYERFDSSNKLKTRWYRPIPEIIAGVVDKLFIENNEAMKTLLLNVHSAIKLACISFCSIELASYILQNSNYPIDYQEPKYLRTAIQWATYYTKLDRFKLLVEFGADINVLDKVGQSPLNYYYHLQSNDEKSDLLKILLRMSSSTVLKKCIKELLWLCTKETIKTLFESISDIYQICDSRNVQESLMLNSDLTFFDIIELMKSDVDVNLQYRGSEDTPLIKEIRTGSCTNVELLLQYGADVNAIVYGTSALVKMSLNIFPENIIEMTELLLQYGAEAQISFTDERTLIEYCLQHPQKEQCPIKPILAHLAMITSIDQSSLTESTRRSINADEMSKKHFDLCSQQIEQLKSIVLCESVSLFRILVEYEKSFVRYARNLHFLRSFESAIKNISSFETYYLNSLQKQIDRAIKWAKLEKMIAEIVEKSTGLLVDVQHLIVYKIIGYLESKDIFEFINSVE